MNIADKNGVTTREHLRQAGAVSELQPPVEFPVELTFPWEVFLELNSARPEGAMGSGKITYSEIKAWCDVMECNLSALQIRVIRRLDMVWESVKNNRRNK
jgi:hypothetical protein